MVEDLGIRFEYVVRRFIGGKAYGIAGYGKSNAIFRRALRDITPSLRRKIDLLDATARHKERLLNDVEEIHDLLKVRGGGTDKDIIVSLFSLVSYLFGFADIDGRVYNLPFYHQTHGQYIATECDNDWRGHRQNVYTIRQEVYSFLKKDRKLSDQVIAGVLNTTEHQIKRLKHKI